MGVTAPCVDPEEVCKDPTASQVLALVQAIRPKPVTGWALPRMPLVIGTITACEPEELPPVAKQVVVLAQATPEKLLVPATAWALPGMPLATGTTTP
jgi:hypothetical protein